MNLNSLLHVPKSYGDYNMPPSFATILFSSLTEAKISFTVQKEGKFNDILIATLPSGEKKRVKITGDSSVVKIKKLLTIK